MADINEFIDKLGEDIGANFAPRIQAEVLQIGEQIADSAAPRVRDFADQLVKDIFAQQSNTIRDFVISLIQDLVGRYEPSLAGNLRTKIVDQGIELVSDDIRLEMKERATGNLVTSLDLPVHFRIEMKDMFVKLDSATIRLENVQL